MSSYLRCILCEMYVPHENHQIIGIQSDITNEEEREE